MTTFDKKTDDSWKWLEKYELPSIAMILAVITSRFKMGYTLQTLEEENIFDIYLWYNMATDLAKKEKKEMEKAKNKNGSSNHYDVENDFDEQRNYENLRKEINY
jgi:hypothetical protein